jgi:hypothetical protein
MAQSAWKRARMPGLSLVEQAAITACCLRMAANVPEQVLAEFRDDIDDIVLPGAVQLGDDVGAQTAAPYA